MREACREQDGGHRFGEESIGSEVPQLQIAFIRSTAVPGDQREGAAGSEPAGAALLVPSARSLGNGEDVAHSREARERAFWQDILLL